MGTLRAPSSPAIADLYDWLLQQNYTQVAREAICAHAAEYGTPEGCEYIEPEDIAIAERVLAGDVKPCRPFEPSDEDSRWWAEATEPFVPSDQDWADAYAPTDADWADYHEWRDRVDAMSAFE